MNKTKVTISDVEHIAELSRLNFNDKQKENIRQNLDEIVNYFDSISTIKCKVSENPFNSLGSFREDNIETSLNKKEVVSNAPYKNDNSFIVPRVVE